MSHRMKLQIMSSNTSSAYCKEVFLAEGSVGFAENRVPYN